MTEVTLEPFEGQIDLGNESAYSAYGELAKLGAFLRRDFLTAWSYRTAFVSDIGGMFLQALMFSFVSKLVDPRILPSYGGTHAGYLEFVVVGMLLSTFLQIGMSHVAGSIRNEQLMGTLESVLLTPTAIGTIQVGSVVYAIVYVPIRTLLFFGLIAGIFGVHLSAVGILPAIALLVLFTPFVWGVGVLAAAGMLTFRRGVGANFAVSLLLLGSGAFFPLSVLPRWIQHVAVANPIARAIDGMRAALIAGDFHGFGTTALIVFAASVITFGLGLFAFKLALARERARGTLGVY